MDLCKFTRLGTIGAALALLAAADTTALGQTTYYTSARTAQPGVSGEISSQSMSLQTTRDGRTIAVEMRDDKVVSATIDGEKVPKDRIKVTEDKVIIEDEDGEVVFEMARGGGRADAWIIGPNQRLFGPGNWQGLRGLQGEMIAPADPPPVMLGVSLAEPDRGLRRHFGLEEGKCTLLAAVYDDLPADKAGLKPYDIIVSINGDDDAGQNEVREALRDAEAGETITFGVIQNGQRKDVRVKLEKYDQERLSEAARKYREEHGDEEGIYQFGLPFGEGDASRWFAPDSDELRRQLRQRFEGEAGERLRQLQREQSERARELRRQLEPSGRPRGEQRAGGGAGRGDDAQLDRLEDRLDRLERMLERLAEEKSSSGSRR